MAAVTDADSIASDAFVTCPCDGRPPCRRRCILLSPRSTGSRSRAGRARPRVDEHPILTEDAVHHARLARVGLCRDRDARKAVRVLDLFLRRRERVDDGGLEVTDAATVERAYRDDLLDAGAADLERVGVELGKSALLARVDHRLVRLAEELHRQAVGAQRDGRVADEGMTSDSLIAASTWRAMPAFIGSSSSGSYPPVSMR